MSRIRSRNWISTKAPWALALIGSLALAGAAQAKGKAKPKPKPPATKPVPVKVPPVSAEGKKAMVELLGAFKFGMTKDEVVGVLGKQIDERYAEKITATNDVNTQDKLRKEKKDELAAITKSYVEFKGQKTGWDVSIIDDQFARNTDESMLVYWENAAGKNQRRFFLFFEGKLWRMFIALDSKKISDEQRNFATFRTIMESRFGAGAIDPTGEEWKTPELAVKAIDRLRFYDAFCLVVTDPRAEKQVVDNRVAKAPAAKGQDGLMKSVLEKGDDKIGLDENAGAVDAIIGKGKQKP
ncbi:MAG: hypothetical protein K8W52_11450 [Deltaproteobacteria bacterium]|nr:hypothetical protein [Deltaproteobacteria bacterium]